MPTKMVDIEPQSAIALIEADVTPLCVVAGQSGPPVMLKRWLPILVKFASIQAVVQVLGFAAGILIVRTLPKRDYALYTIGNTMLATI